MVNKYKKRLIEDWKQYGFLTLSYIEYYRRMKLINDLKLACRFYIKYVDVKGLIWENNI